MILKLHDLTALKLRSHSAITHEDAAALRDLPSQTEYKRAGEDIVRQGDRPNVAVVVISGWVARYHSLVNGRRQFLSFHCAGDMPDAQSLFLDRMDHSVCAIDDAVIATIPHRRILEMFTQRPSLGIAIWRETLVDAAIFRQTITSLGSRDPRERLAHFFAEHFERASNVKLTSNGVCPFPLTQQQIGDALGMAPVTMSRALRTLRETGAVDLRDQQLIVNNWEMLAEIGQFDDAYLHLR